MRLVPNIKPALLRSHPRYDEVAAAGLFVADDDGTPVEAQFWDEVGSYIDMTKSRSRRLVARSGHRRAARPWHGSDVERQ